MSKWSLYLRPCPFWQEFCSPQTNAGWCQIGTDATRSGFQPGCQLAYSKANACSGWRLDTRAEQLRFMSAHKASFRRKCLQASRWPSMSRLEGLPEASLDSQMKSTAVDAVSMDPKSTAGPEAPVLYCIQSDDRLEMFPERSCRLQAWGKHLKLKMDY